MDHQIITDYVNLLRRKSFTGNVLRKTALRERKGSSAKLMLGVGFGAPRVPRGHLDIASEGKCVVYTVNNIQCIYR